jgi:hypothetical protein
MHSFLAILAAVVPVTFAAECGPLHYVYGELINLNYVILLQSIDIV